MARRVDVLEKVPAEPFTRWLNERYEFHCRRMGVVSDPDLNRMANPSLALCDEIGWPEHGIRRLYRYRHGRVETHKGRTKTRKGVPLVKPATHWRRDVVEEALHHAGVPFSDLYPEIAAAEDIPLERAMTCWKCNDVVHTIHGMCPWCDTQLRYGNELAEAA